MGDVTLTPGERLQSAVSRGASHLPAPVTAAIARCAGERPVNEAGDRLAPEIWTGIRIRQRLADRTGLTELTEVTPARRFLEATTAIYGEPADRRIVQYELTFDGPDGPLAATRYTPPVSHGVVVYFHGGGFVLGSRATHDGLCRFLAVNAGVDVVSIEYRLAPEHPFPAAADDALAGWRWVTDSLMPNAAVRVVAGDSAGGNLAAVTAQQLRGTDAKQPDLQLLFYPVVDLVVERDSMREFAHGYELDHEELMWFKERYIGSAEECEDPRASPILADDLSGLPAAYIAVAGFDPLRDEGIEYAERLRDAGVPVRLYRAGTLIHGFASLTAISRDSRIAVLDACRAIRDVTATVTR